MSFQGLFKPLQQFTNARTVIRGIGLIGAIWGLFFIWNNRYVFETTVQDRGESTGAVNEARPESKVISETDADDVRDQSRDPNLRSSIILDLDRDGVETTVLNTYVRLGVRFDHDGNGFAESTGWVGKDDGLLVRDIDSNGYIEGGEELFGDNTLLSNGEKAANGFEALLDLDSVDNGGNADGVLDSNDAQWSTLKVWIDSDGDARTDEGELLTLDEVGIESFNLNYTQSSIVDVNGNQHKQLGTYVKSDGSTSEMNDVWFQTDSMMSTSTEWLMGSPDLFLLPDTQGYGNVRSLWQAMVKDESGELQALVEQFSSSVSRSEREGLMDSILIHWAGAKDVVTGSRGGYIDAKKLAVLESFVGEDLGKNPGRKATPIAMTGYNGLREYFFSELNEQVVLSFFYSAISIDETGELIIFNSDAVVSILAGIEDQASSLALLSDFANLIDVAEMTDGVNYNYMELITALAPLGIGFISIIEEKIGKDVLGGTESDQLHETRE